jgi:hypothetical protein
MACTCESEIWPGMIAGLLLVGYWGKGGGGVPRIEARFQ